MKKILIVLLVSSVIVTIVQLIVIDYTNLNFSKNWSSYLSILSMILIIKGLIGLDKYDKKKENKD